MTALALVFYAVFLVSVLASQTTTLLAYDYKEALEKSILFYEGQRSGKLPRNQRLPWRADSALRDGFQQDVDLTGGYYDAGDNVKFGLPMAFTITMLSWSVIEYDNQLANSDQLDDARDAIKWGTDYLIKAHPEPNVLWGEVGDGITDHRCWQRPEDMTTSRQAYRIDSENPGSDLAGETAAAMAAASLVFRLSDHEYANTLVQHAKQLFTFADTNRAKYDSSIGIARPFYESISGYEDELLWAATWLYQATDDQYYINYVTENAGILGGTASAMKEFSWDVKYAGVQVLVTTALLQTKFRNAEGLQAYRSKAEYFLCACMQKNRGDNVKRTPGGLMYWREWNNMQYVTSASFLLTVYSDYLSSVHQQLQCPDGSVQPRELLSLAQSQMDYILGNNPRGTSYMVGYGSNYPQRVHHRGASIISFKVDPTFVSCDHGYAIWYSRNEPDPNVLTGALVGGPDESDNYFDERENYQQSEPATYNNAPLVGVLARLNSGFYTQFNPGAVNHSLNISVTQSVIASWNLRGRTYYEYAVSVRNKSPAILQELRLSLKRLYGPLWGLSRIGKDIYTFPHWLQSVSSGDSFDFVYIHAAPEIDISVLFSVFG